MGSMGPMGGGHDDFGGGGFSSMFGPGMGGFGGGGPMGGALSQLLLQAVLHLRLASCDFWAPKKCEHVNLAVSAAGGALGWMVPQEERFDSF